MIERERKKFWFTFLALHWSIEVSKRNDYMSSNWQLYIYCSLLFWRWWVVEQRQTGQEWIKLKIEWVTGNWLTIGPTFISIYIILSTWWSWCNTQLQLLHHRYYMGRSLTKKEQKAKKEKKILLFAFRSTLFMRLMKRKNETEPG